MRKILIFVDGKATELFKGEADFVIGNAMSRVTMMGQTARRLDRTSLPENIEIMSDERLPKTLEEFDAVCPEGADWFN